MGLLCMKRVTFVQTGGGEADREWGSVKHVLTHAIEVELATLVVAKATSRRHAESRVLTWGRGDVLREDGRPVHADPKRKTASEGQLPS